MSKFHRNKKKTNSAQDKRALWLLGVAAVVIVILFVFMG